MLIQFQVASDETTWLLDTVQMRYARTEGEDAESKIVEMGKLVFVGLHGPLRVFALEGRTPKTDGPGGNLCTFGYALMDMDDVITFYLQANVPIKNVCSRRPVTTVRYELIPLSGQEPSPETVPETIPEVALDAPPAPEVEVQ